MSQREKNKPLSDKDKSILKAVDQSALKLVQWLKVKVRSCVITMVHTHIHTK